MPKLSKANIYAIRWLHSQGKSSEEISIELKLTTKQVENTFDTSEPPPIINSQTPKTDTKSLMITQTSGKGTNSVAIMTKQASELVDELKKNHVAPKSSTGIFRPRNQ